MKLTFQLLSTALLSTILMASATAQTCKRKASNNSLAEALKACQEAQTKKSTQQSLQGLLTLGQTDFCKISSDKNENQILKEKLCRDPNGTACLNEGKILDSKCQYMPLESFEASSDPSFLAAQCAADESWNKFSQAHKKECPKATNAKSCNDLLTLKYASEKAKFLRDKVYTEAKKNKLRSIFDNVKTQYIKLIQNSSKISPNVKPYLEGKIETTRLALDESDLANKEHSECHNDSPEKVSTGIYNSPQKEGSSQREIHFCIGSVATMDYLNPYVLIHTIAHELSHSIDPCMTEQDMLESGSPSPNFYQRLYKDTVNCLRGGSGPEACNNAVLNCNEDKGRIEFCNEKYQGQPGCVEQLRMMPNCAIGKKDPSHNENISADYRKAGTQEDQIGESFSDFMAAEILAKFLQEDSSESSKLDGLLSIASTTSRLHGTCLKENTPDPHPPGFLRMNRIIMSSDTFRQSVGCYQGPPQTNKAKVTCSGF